MTKTRTIALALALALPSTSALAFSFSYERPQRHSVPSAPYGSAPSAGLGVHDGPHYERCTASSAAEGNANQQTRPVKQYGQTAGGYRC